MQKKKRDYIDLLSDRLFLRWQLLPEDEELSLYWQSMIDEDSGLIAEINRAVAFLKSEGFNKSRLDDVEQIELLEKIVASIGRQRKRVRNRILYFSLSGVAAIVAIILTIGVLRNLQNDGVAQNQNELIVGEMLSDSDIKLISKGETLTFNTDISVTLDEDGNANIVDEKNSETSRVNIARDQLSQLIVPYGKRSTLTLADGSKVWLNSGSVLEFPAQFSGDSRSIKLSSGEMYIEVAKVDKKPFFVVTEQFNVKVYGTKFNVTAYEDTPHSLVLVEGSVGLNSGVGSELLLKPSEQAVITDVGVFETNVVNIDRFISWKDGYLQFEKTPMNEVLRQIGKYYNLKFDFDNDVNIQKRTCNGKIYLSEDLDNVMTTIGILSSTNYRKEGNRIIITN